MNYENTPNKMENKNWFQKIYVLFILLKSTFDLFSVLYDYLANIFWKRSDIENLARSLVSHIISYENLF